MPAPRPKKEKDEAEVKKKPSAANQQKGIAGMFAKAASKKRDQG